MLLELSDPDPEVSFGAAEFGAAEEMGRQHGCWAEMEKIIQFTGFYRTKTNSLIKLGQALCDRFGGEVPNRLRDMVTLPGVGRKAANVALSNAFGIPGITVDTHFDRLARRFGWTTEEDRSRSRRTSGRCSPSRTGPCCRTG